MSLWQVPTDKQLNHRVWIKLLDEGRKTRKGVGMSDSSLGRSSYSINDGNQCVTELAIERTMKLTLFCHILPRFGGGGKSVFGQLTNNVQSKEVTQENDGFDHRVQKRYSVKKKKKLHIYSNKIKISMFLGIMYEFKESLAERFQRTRQVKVIIGPIWQT